MQDRIPVEEDGLDVLRGSTKVTLQGRLNEVCRAAERTLEERRSLVLLAFTILYLLGTVPFASRRLLWFDEIFTAVLSRTGSVGQLFSALRAGVDVTPPFFNLITNASVALFGHTELGLRVPGILGFWLMCVALHAMVRRRGSPLWALCALLIPFCAGSRIYNVEARPYGLLLGATACAVLCWDTIQRYDRSRWSVFLLAAALFVTGSLHYYGVLIAVPLAAGEVFSSFKRRRIDWRVFGALLVAPLASLLIHLSFIQAALSYSGASWSAPDAHGLYGAYVFLFGSATAVAAVFVALAASAVVTWQKRSRSILQLDPLIVTALCLLALPLFALGVARASNGIFTARYAIATTLGIALAIPLSMRSISVHHGFVPLSCAGLTSFAFVAWISSRLIVALGPPGLVPLPAIASERMAADSVLVVEHPHTYLQYAYYWPASSHQQIAYVAQPELARKFDAIADDDRSLLLLRRMTSINVITPNDLSRKNAMVYSVRARPGWLLRYLLQTGHSISLRSVTDPFLVFAVQRDNP